MDEQITLRDLLERIERRNNEDHEEIIVRLDKMNGRTDALEARVRTNEQGIVRVQERQRTLAVVTNVAAAIEAAVAGVIGALK